LSQRIGQNGVGKMNVPIDDGKSRKSIEVHPIIIYDDSQYSIWEDEQI
jgi:hypothetical protein